MGKKRYKVHIKRNKICTNIGLLTQRHTTFVLLSKKISHLKLAMQIKVSLLVLMLSTVLACWEHNCYQLTWLAGRCLF